MKYKIQLATKTLLLVPLWCTPLAEAARTQNVRGGYLPEFGGWSAFAIMCDANIILVERRRSPRCDSHFNHRHMQPHVLPLCRRFARQDELETCTAPAQESTRLARAFSQAEANWLDLAFRRRRATRIDGERGQRQKEEIELEVES